MAEQDLNAAPVPAANYQAFKVGRGANIGEQRRVATSIRLVLPTAGLLQSSPCATHIINSFIRTTDEHIHLEPAVEPPATAFSVGGF